MSAPPPPMNHEGVLALAHLAHLDLADDEAMSVGSHLGRILTFVAQLQELDLLAVPPTSDVQIEQASLRSDDERPGLPREQVLDQAPQVVDDSFAVPPFVEG